MAKLRLDQRESVLRDLLFERVEDLRSEFDLPPIQNKFKEILYPVAAETKRTGKVYEGQRRFDILLIHEPHRFTIIEVKGLSNHRCHDTSMGVMQLLGYAALVRDHNPLATTNLILASPRMDVAAARAVREYNLPVKLFYCGREEWGEYEAQQT